MLFVVARVICDCLFFVFDCSLDIRRRFKVSEFVFSVEIIDVD